MRAVKFDNWMTAKKAGLLQGEEISSNEWVQNADRFRLPKMLGLQVGLATLLQQLVSLKPSCCRQQDRASQRVEPGYADIVIA